ncbi:DsrH/TusB family sulfur metabolism protein [Alishewanella longhuensis]
MKLISLITPGANLDELASLASSNDVLLLRQDAVYLALQATLPFPGRILALDSDVSWRNITLPAAIHAISDAEWVTLSVAATQCLLWS